MNSFEHFSEYLRCMGERNKATTRFEYRLFAWLTRWHRRKVPFTDMVAFVILQNGPRIAANLAKCNALFARLKADREGGQLLP